MGGGRHLIIRRVQNLHGSQNIPHSRASGKPGRPGNSLGAADGATCRVTSGFGFRGSGGHPDPAGTPSPTPAVPPLSGRRSGRSTWTSVTPADVQIRCQTPGVVSRRLTVPWAGSTPSSTCLTITGRARELTTASDSGSDEATDGEFYHRLMRQHGRLLTTAGPQGGYLHPPSAFLRIAGVVASLPSPGRWTFMCCSWMTAPSPRQESGGSACRLQRADTVRP